MDHSNEQEIRLHFPFVWIRNSKSLLSHNLPYVYLVMYEVLQEKRDKM